MKDKYYTGWNFILNYLVCPECLIQARGLHNTWFDTTEVAKDIVVDGGRRDRIDSCDSTDIYIFTDISVAWIYPYKYHCIDIFIFLLIVIEINVLLEY